MVYVDPKNLGYKPYWTKWLKSRKSPEEKAKLEKLFELYVPKLIQLIIEGKTVRPEEMMQEGAPEPEPVPSRSQNAMDDDEEEGGSEEDVPSAMTEISRALEKPESSEGTPLKTIIPQSDLNMVSMKLYVTLFLMYEQWKKNM